jgi:hypothetical protein
MGKGQDRASTISSGHNYYYRTLIKLLILLPIQLIAQHQTGPRHLAYPPPFMGMGPVPHMHQNHKRAPDLALVPFLPPNRIKHL